MLDGGNFLRDRKYMREMVDETYVKGMMTIGYDAGAIGEQEFYLGTDYLLGVLEAHGYPGVMANAYDESTGEPLVKPYMVIERAGVRFGITAVLAPTIELKTDASVEKLGIRVGDPVEALSLVLPELRKKSDIIILITRLGLEASKEFVSKVDGIDFLLVGRQSSYSAEPFEEGGTVFMQPGHRGQYMTEFHLKFDEEGNYTGYTGEAVILNDKVPADAAIALLIREHKELVDTQRKKDAAERAKEAAEKRRPKYVEDYLGVNNSCIRCHKQEHDHWLETPHAHAYETLERALKSSDPGCLRCHTTGQLDLPLDGSREVDVELRGVQCEACHGIGANHARDGSYGKIMVSSCVACHDKENSPDFDYATYLKEVKH